MSTDTPSLLAHFVRSGHPYLAVQTWEPWRFVEEEVIKIQKACDELSTPKKLTFFTWDAIGGLRRVTKAAEDPELRRAKLDLEDETDEEGNPTTNQLAPFRIIENKVKEALAANKGRAGTAAVGDMVCFYFIQNNEAYADLEQWMQIICNTVTLFKENGVTFVLVGPTVDIRPGSPLSHSIHTVNTDLPDSTEFRKLYDELSTQQEGNESLTFPKGKKRDEVINSLAGLTLLEAEGASFLSLIKKATIDPSEIFQTKKAQIEGTGALQILDSQEHTLKSLGGLSALKKYTAGLLKNAHKGKAKPRGILLLGVPGTGKSHFCKGLGKDVGLPVLKLDLTAVRNKYVGESERILRETFNIIKSFGRSIVFIDEIEKQITGGRGSGEGNSTVEGGILAIMLQNMDDAGEHGIFFVATCNDSSALPPELTRSGRMNATFFIDLPTVEEKEAIWKIWTKFYGVSLDSSNPVDDAKWTGADIRNACEQAELLGIPVHEVARDYVVPLMVSNSHQLDALREWANGKCIDASAGGRYRESKVKAGSSGARKPGGDKDSPSLQRKPGRTVDI